jgi:hypothetical protein
MQGLPSLLLILLLPPLLLLLPLPLLLLRRCLLLLLLLRRRLLLLRLLRRRLVPVLEQKRRLPWLRLLSPLPPPLLLLCACSLLAASRQAQLLQGFVQPQRRHLLPVACHGLHAIAQRQRARATDGRCGCSAAAAASSSWLLPLLRRGGCRGPPGRGPSRGAQLWGAEEDLNIAVVALRRCGGACSRGAATSRERPPWAALLLGRRAALRARRRAQRAHPPRLLPPSLSLQLPALLLPLG